MSMILRTFTNFPGKILKHLLCAGKCKLNGLVFIKSSHPKTKTLILIRINMPFIFVKLQLIFGLSTSFPLFTSISNLSHNH